MIQRLSAEGSGNQESLAKVTIYPVPDSSVIGIKSNSSDPETAASVANAMAETYVLSTHEVGQTATDELAAG